jgi:hypothetical protein
MEKLSELYLNKGVKTKSIPRFTGQESYRRDPEK